MEYVAKQTITREGVTPSWLSLTLLLGALAHTLAVWLAFQMGFFHASNPVFYWMLGLFWACNLGLYAWGMVSERHRTDRFMAVALYWSVLAVLTSTLFIDELRLCLMIFIFAILQTTIFRAPRRLVMSLGVFVVVGYAMVLGIIYLQEPTRIEWAAELIQWGAFSLVLLGTVVLVLDLVNLQSALGLQNQRLIEVTQRIEEMAIRDELTGLYNRRYAMEKLERMSSLADRNQFDLHLVYLDLDHFKKVNDTYGHNAGDEVLKHFAKVMQQDLFHRDFAARIGGEEFLILLVQRSEQEAAQCVESLMQRWRQQQFEVDANLKMTLSAGLCTRQTHISVVDWLACADEALYEAKNTGRDKMKVRVLTLGLSMPTPEIRD